MVKATFEKRDPAKLKNHLANIKIYGGKEPSPEFIESCKDGIHTPLLILPDGMIISGHSRRFAGIHWKHKEVPVIVRFDLADDPLEAERVLILCNRQREKTGEQMAREAARLLEIEQELAAKRVAATQRKGPAGVNVPQPENIEKNGTSGRSAEKVGEALGVSGKTAAKLAEAGRAIVEAEEKGDTEKAEKVKAAVNKSASAGQRAAREPKTANAVRSNGKATVKGKEIIEAEVTKAFGSVTRLIDKQARDCDQLNTASHRLVIDKLNAALEQFKWFTKECQRAIARK